MSVLNLIKMKEGLEETVVFRVDSDADSAFLKEEVRRLASKLVSQYRAPCVPKKPKKLQKSG